MRATATSRSQSSSAIARSIGELWFPPAPCARITTASAVPDGTVQGPDHTVGIPVDDSHELTLAAARAHRMPTRWPGHEKLEVTRVPKRRGELGRGSTSITRVTQGVSSIPRLSDTTFTDPSKIRNFCIIAHIDHGKSTLADRMLQVTGVVEGRDMRAQYLDRMDIERERGITIKAQNVRLPWNVDGTDYVMHLIDTPGHVDFTYEVSRALEACEGAVLLVDAAQGIEAQTLANLYLALDKDLTIIPVLNKIDLPAADPDRYAAEIAHIIGCEPGDVLRVSGKTGVGVTELLDEVVKLIPAPVGDPDAPARAMIFDSVYDTYRGVVTYVRVVDGKIVPREKIKMMSTGTTHELPRGRHRLARPEALEGPRCRRGRLPHHRREGRPSVEGR